MYGVHELRLVEIFSLRLLFRSKMSASRLDWEGQTKEWFDIKNEGQEE